VGDGPRTGKLRLVREINELEFSKHLAKLIELVVGKREMRDALEQVGRRLIERL
jgi:hypothetical protein